MVFIPAYKAAYDRGMTHLDTDSYIQTLDRQIARQSIASAGKGWDLHCHTVFSDGTETPQSMIQKAQRIGLQGLAITDHDTTKGWEEARQAAISYNFPVMLGTEITSEFSGISVHMLAYQYDESNASLVDLFEATRMARLERARNMVALISQDFPLSWDDVLAQVKEGDRTTIGRPHIADALVAKGVYDNRSQAFHGVCAASSPYYLPTPSPSAKQVVRAVKLAGGVAVIAHPGATKRNKVLLSDDQIEELVEVGLDGLEIWHRDNLPAERKRFLGLADRFHMIITGGSDWHGQGKINQLGENTTSASVVNAIIARSRLG